MNEKILVSITFSLLITCSVNADELVPATSEDVSDFEVLVTNQALSETKALQPRPDHPSKGPMKETPKETTKLRKENFGLIVSTEAKRLKEPSGEDKRGMGQWVSEQRRNDRHRGDSVTAGSGSGSSGSSEARRAAQERKSPDRDSGRRKDGDRKK
ncbi:MAG: hypothetical protein JNM39_04645 [Bdellovibrionaceae bacterium]|nr:hypothetical protein [Pseudobdellovibrionaceae bacterium]